MAFLSEEITKEEDKSYFNSLALTGMTGDLLSPGWWTIDREKILFYMNEAEAHLRCLWDMACI